jgi:hypothetical protein
MSIPFLPIHTLSQRLMSKTNRRQLWRQQAGAQAPQGGPVFVSPEDQFRMSLDNCQYMSSCSTPHLGQGAVAELLWSEH